MAFLLSLLMGQRRLVSTRSLKGKFKAKKYDMTEKNTNAERMRSFLAFFFAHIPEKS